MRCPEAAPLSVVAERSLSPLPRGHQAAGDRRRDDLGGARILPRPGAHRGMGGRGSSQDRGAGARGRTATMSRMSRRLAALALLGSLVVLVGWPLAATVLEACRAPQRLDRALTSLGLDDWALWIRRVWSIEPGLGKRARSGRDRTVAPRNGGPGPAGSTGSRDAFPDIHDGSSRPAAGYSPGFTPVPHRHLGQRAAPGNTGHRGVCAIALTRDGLAGSAWQRGANAGDRAAARPGRPHGSGDHPRAGLLALGDLPGRRRLAHD